MTVSTSTRQLPEKLQQHLEMKQREAANFRHMVTVALSDIGHPVSVPEITSYLKDALGEQFTTERVRFALNALMEQGRVFSRQETPEERAIRFEDGRKPMALPANLYSLENPVPARTQPAIGELLTGPTKKRRKKRKAQPARTPAAATPTTQERLHTTAEAIDYLVEKIVAERTRELQAELNEANLKLMKLKGLLDN